MLLQFCLQVGEEEKDVSELLPAWGKDVAAAVVSRGSAAAAQHGQQHTQSAAPQSAQQHGQTVQQAGMSAAAAAAGPAGSSSRDAGADASSLAPGGSIELRNVYFEAVPLHLVSAVITDKGVLDKAQVAALMEARGKGYQRAFGLDLPDDMLAA